MASLPMHEPLPRFRLHQDGRSISLTPGLNEEELREGQLLFEVQSVQGGRLFFDDQPLSAMWSDDGSTAYGQLDLTNQVGFHRFSLQTAKESVSFDIRTTTAKATHAEVESMARVVAGQVFSFKRQFVYADATGRRRTIALPEIALGWLRDRLAELTRLVRSIDARPATETRQQFTTSHQARGVSVPHTLRLLRETPGLLEARSDGPLDVDGHRYWPAAVVVRERNREPARVEHMQLAHFLSRVARLLADLRGVVPRDVLPTVAEWELQIRAVRALHVVRRHDVPNAHAAWTPIPTQLQKTDPRYRRVRELHSEFLQDIDVADYSTDSVRANVRDVWEIYQSFAAHMIGRAFGLTYASRRGDLRERRGDGCSMYSEEYELFYDCRVPARARIAYEAPAHGGRWELIDADTREAWRKIATTVAQTIAREMLTDGAIRAFDVAYCEIVKHSRTEREIDAALHAGMRAALVRALGDVAPVEPVADVDSPNSVPVSLSELEARSFARINRDRPRKIDAEPAAERRPCPLHPNTAKAWLDKNAERGEPTLGEETMAWCVLEIQRLVAEVEALRAREGQR